jgi:hypothetical protein
VPLNFSSDLQDIIDTGWWIDHVAVDIVLANSGGTLRYATANLTFDSDVYVDRLKGIADMSESLSAVPDRVTVTIYNADGAAGLVILDPSEVLDGATCTVYRIFIDVKDPDNSFRQEVFYGIVDNVSSTELDLSLEVISDIEACDTIAGDLKVSKICQSIYKHPTQCGYDGDIPTCDRTLDGINGCKIHFPGNEALSHFTGFAVFLDDATVQSLYNKNVPPPPPPPQPMIAPTNQRYSNPYPPGTQQYLYYNTILAHVMKYEALGKDPSRYLLGS